MAYGKNIQMSTLKDGATLDKLYVFVKIVFDITWKLMK